MSTSCTWRKIETLRKKEMRIVSVCLFPEDWNFMVLWLGTEGWVFMCEVARLRL